MAPPSLDHLKRVRIVGGPFANDFRVEDAQTGAEIPGVRKIEFVADAKEKGLAVATLTVIVEASDVVLVPDVVTEPR